MALRTVLMAALTGLAFACGAAAADAPGREQARLLTATQVLEELRGSRDQAIPDRLLERAYGIAVIPDMTKIAWFFGGRRGHGVLLVRDKDGRFTSPVFITMTGGSFGFQWGVQLTDVVLVFTTPKGVEGINGGKVTLGGDASVAAGPVGRQASAGTDATFKAEVYSYSRNRGAFVGLALDGSVISIDDRADGDFYGKPGIAAADILSGSVRSNDEAARRFLAAVSTSTEGQQRQASAAPAPAPAASRTTPAPAPSQNGAQSFPLSDPRPGSEPK
ncbi:MAG TPA: lipid-binding SYLF domain-containing protein [Steroidobacteraceae bacterium]|nr:lipid-binding SYLF domain-containing protein [Steroidobacteraceae bacterium]